MLTSGINFKSFQISYKQKYVKSILKKIIKEKNQILLSLSENYKNSFNNKLLKKFKYQKNFRLIGMGGSSLGSQTIYQFLNKKIKKNFVFVDNLQATIKKDKKKKIHKFNYF